MWINRYQARKDLLLNDVRIDNLSQLAANSEFLFNLPDYPKEMLIFKKSDLNKTTEGLNLALGVLGKIHHSEWSQNKINTTIEEIMNKRKLSPGDIFWPLRVACSGLEKSPSPVELLEFLGKDEALTRIKKAINKLK